jgi:hypothetical protein
MQSTYKLLLVYLQVFPKYLFSVIFQHVDSSTKYQQSLVTPPSFSRFSFSPTTRRRESGNKDVEEESKPKAAVDTTRFTEQGNKVEETKLIYRNNVPIKCYILTVSAYSTRLVGGVVRSHPDMKIVHDRLPG